MSLVIGVDPGKSGALALLGTDGSLLGVIDMPVAGKIVVPALLCQALQDAYGPANSRAYPYAPVEEAVAVIEDVHSMPGQGVSSSFSFGRSLGVVEGVLAADGWALHYVSPSKWKKAMGLTADKGMARRRACELWPAQAQWFARVKDDGRAEAALIGLWWIKHNGGAM